MMGVDEAGTLRREWWVDVDAGFCYTKLIRDGGGRRGEIKTIANHLFLVEAHCRRNEPNHSWGNRISPEFWDWLPEQ